MELRQDRILGIPQICLNKLPTSVIPPVHRVLPRAHAAKNDPLDDGRQQQFDQARHQQ